MGILKKVLVLTAGAVASYYATRYAKKLLDEKPLQERLSGVRGNVKGKVKTVKARVDDKLDAISHRIDRFIDRKLDDKE